MTERLDRFAAVWTALGRLIASAPDADTLATLRSDDLLGAWPLEAGPRVADGLALWRDSAVSGEDAGTLKDDHFRLFRGPGAVLAPPWESVYTSQEGLLFEPETLDVRREYARHGLMAPRLDRDPDDHISLELEFCATLLIRAMDAIEAGDTARAEELEAAHDAFCRDHLLAFAPRFFALVEQGATTLFYRGLGVLGSDAMAQLQDELARA